MSNPLLDLLADIDADVRKATPEVILMALDIMERERTRIIEEAKRDPSKLALLKTYKNILSQYTTYKILWHRWCRRGRDWDTVYSHRVANQPTPITSSIKRYKADLMKMFELVKAAFVGITYRELNKLSLKELAFKWCGLTM